MTAIPRAPLVWGALLRLALLPFAEPLFGDAPVRTMLAWHLAERGELGWAWPTVFQYGPFPLNSVALLLRLGLPRDFGPAVFSAACGVLAIWFAMRLAARFTDDRGAISTAGFLVALDPLHLAASTTFVSEALFSAAALALAEALVSGARLPLLAAAFIATTTRYDAWLALPFVALGWGALRGLSLRTVVEGGLLLAPGPASILLANLWAIGDPLRPLAHIQSEHVLLGAQLAEHFGPFWGRVRGLVFWLAVPALIAGPVAAWALLRGLGAALRDPRVLAVLALGWIAPATYVVRSVVSNAFFPMARLAILPVSLLVAVIPVPTHLRRAAIGSLLALDLLLVAGTIVGAPVAGVVASTSPLSRWPEDVRVARDRFLEAPEATTVVPEGDYEDLVIACGAGASEAWTFVTADRRAFRSRVIVKAGSDTDRWLESSGARVDWVAGRFRAWRR